MRGRAATRASTMGKVEAWHQAIAPTGGRGASHSRFLADPEAVARSNRAHIHSRVVDFVQTLGVTVPSEAIDAFVDAIGASL